MTTLTASPAIAKFNSLTASHQMLIKRIIFDVIAKNTRVSPHDLANFVRNYFWQKPDYDYREITDHLQAGTWALEEMGEIDRLQNKSGNWVLEIVQF